MAAAPKTPRPMPQINAPVLYIEFRKDNKPIILIMVGGWTAEGARMKRKHDYAFWTFVTLAVGWSDGGV